MKKPEPHPAYFDGAEAFQLAFGKYFPLLLTDDEAAGFEMCLLEASAFITPWPPIRRARAKVEMEKTVKALRLLGQQHLPYRALYGFAKQGKAKREHEALGRFLWWWTRLEEQGLAGRVIEDFVADVVRCIDGLPDAGNLNWKAIQAVDALRVCWQRNTGKAPPSRGLNPASKFHAYLFDGFKLLNVEGDPVSAFKRWVAVTAKRG